VHVKHSLLIIFLRSSENIEQTHFILSISLSLTPQSHTTISFPLFSFLLRSHQGSGGHVRALNAFLAQQQCRIDAFAARVVAVASLDEYFGASSPPIPSTPTTTTTTTGGTGDNDDDGDGCDTSNTTTSTTTTTTTMMTMSTLDVQTPPPALAVLPNDLFLLHRLCAAYYGAFAAAPTKTKTAPGKTKANAASGKRDGDGNVDTPNIVGVDDDVADVAEPEPASGSVLNGFLGGYVGAVDSENGDNGGGGGGGGSGGGGGGGGGGEFDGERDVNGNDDDDDVALRGAWSRVRRIVAALNLRGAPAPLSPRDNTLIALDLGLHQQLPGDNDDAPWMFSMCVDDRGNEALRRTIDMLVAALTQLPSLRRVVSVYTVDENGGDGGGDGGGGGSGGDGGGGGSGVLALLRAEATRVAAAGAVFAAQAALLSETATSLSAHTPPHLKALDFTPLYVVQRCNAM
jgi:uncharacterized membrane protein YgcG